MCACVCVCVCVLVCEFLCVCVILRACLCAYPRGDEGGAAPPADCADISPSALIRGLSTPKQQNKNKTPLNRGAEAIPPFVSLMRKWVPIAPFISSGLLNINTYKTKRALNENQWFKINKKTSTREQIDTKKEQWLMACKQKTCMHSFSRKKLVITTYCVPTNWYAPAQHSRDSFPGIRACDTSHAPRSEQSKKHFRQIQAAWSWCAAHSMRSVC